MVWQGSSEVRGAGLRSGCTQGAVPKHQGHRQGQPEWEGRLLLSPCSCTPAFAHSGTGLAGSEQGFPQPCVSDRGVLLYSSQLCNSQWLAHEQLILTCKVFSQCVGSFKALVVIWRIQSHEKECSCFSCFLMVKKDKQIICLKWQSMEIKGNLPSSNLTF